MELHDFEVEIARRIGDRFDVKWSSSASGEVRASVGLSQSVDALLAAADAAVSGARSAAGARTFTPDDTTPADVRGASVGQVLFDMLFSEPEVRAALERCVTRAEAEKAGVRLKLTLNMHDEGVADLARLPWELLHDDSQYKHFALRDGFPIVRYLEVPKRFEVEDFTPPLRILVISANPRQDLALDRERDNLRKALAGVAGVALTFVEDASIQRVAEAATRARTDGRAIHVVHYMGHADFHQGHGVLLLHKEGGGDEQVDAEAFARALQAAGQVRLVFLNACNTAQSAASTGTDPFAGVATSLVFEGIPAVVAMQRPVPDAAAIVLAKHFYARIAEGWPVDAAVSEGRRQMSYAAGTSLDWAIPVLFMRTPTGDIFPRPAAPEMGRRAGLPAWLKLAAAAAAGVAIVAAAVFRFSGRDVTPARGESEAVAATLAPSTAEPTKAAEAPARPAGDAVVVPPVPAGDPASTGGGRPGDMRFVKLEAGTFDMGSPSGEMGRSSSEGPVHRVSVAAFELGAYEVTVDQFAAYADANPTLDLSGCHAYKGRWILDAALNWRRPGFEQSGRDPVVCVSWLDALGYVAWLNAARPSITYRLPSESEWEYAARGGTDGARFWRQDYESCAYAVSAFESAMCPAQRGRTREVGTRTANGAGLHDMLGNALEWTADCWNGSYSGAPGDGQPWTTGQCDFRVVRGGSWFHGLDRIRSAFRDRFSPRFRSNQIGFRVVRTLP